MAYVYRHIRIDKNEPFYIGVGSDKNYKRANNNINRNKHWKNIVSKTDYRVDILFDDLTWNEAIVKEVEFISIYGRIDLKTGTLCNLTNGGEGCSGYIFPKERIEKLKKIKTGKKMSLEQRIEFNKNYLKRDLSDLDIEKIKKRINNEALKSAGQKITACSEEKKIKMSKMFTGVNNPFYGKRHSDEFKKNRSQEKIGIFSGGKNPSAKLVINLSNGIFYECALDAANSIGMNKTRFRRMLAGTRINKTNFKYA
jgi:hypothetical protein